MNEAKQHLGILLLPNKKKTLGNFFLENTFPMPSEYLMMIDSCVLFLVYWVTWGSY